MKPHIYGLTGRAGAGKDTAADFLVPLHFRKLAFADSLRAELSLALDVPISVFTDRTTKECPHEDLTLEKTPLHVWPAIALARTNESLDGNGGISLDWLALPRSPRQMMQWWGTEYRRREDPDYWVKSMKKKIDSYMRDGERRFVITDVRFANEAAFVRSIGGEIWQLARPVAEDAPEDQHVSAVTGDDFAPEIVVPNAGDVEALCRQVLAEYVTRDIGPYRDHVTVAIEVRS